MKKSKGQINLESFTEENPQENELQRKEYIKNHFSSDPERLLRCYEDGKAANYHSLYEQLYRGETSPGENLLAVLQDPDNLITEVEEEEILKWIIENDLDKLFSIFRQKHHLGLTLAEITTQSGLKCTPLEYVLSKGPLNISKLLIGQSDANQEHLNLAMKSRNLNLIKWVLEEKKLDAKLTPRHFFLPAEDGGSFIPNPEGGNGHLHSMAKTPSTAIAQWLVKRGLDVNAVNGAGETPLQLAVANWRTSKAQEELENVMRLLLVNGATYQPGWFEEDPGPSLWLWMKRVTFVLSHLQDFQKFIENTPVIGKLAAKEAQALDPIAFNFYVDNVLSEQAENAVGILPPLLQTPCLLKTKHLSNPSQLAVSFESGTSGARKDLLTAAALYQRAPYLPSERFQEPSDARRHRLSRVDQCLNAFMESNPFEGSSKDNRWNQDKDEYDNISTLLQKLGKKGGDLFHPSHSQEVLELLKKVISLKEKPAKGENDLRDLLLEERLTLLSDDISPKDELIKSLDFIIRHVAAKDMQANNERHLLLSH